MKIPVTITKAIGILPLTNVNVYIGNLLFYIGEPYKKFNLPFGTYNIEGNYEFCKKIDYTKLLTFNPRKKHIPVLGIKKIIFGKNPNKCSIFPENGTVLMDKDFYDSLKLKMFVYFILGHEEGHYYFYDEKACDEYSKNKLLKAGYNPSQIYMLSKAILAGKERPKNLLNIMGNGTRK